MNAHCDHTRQGSHCRTKRKHRAFAKYDSSQRSGWPKIGALVRLCYARLSSLIENEFDVAVSSRQHGEQSLLVGIVQRRAIFARFKRFDVADFLTSFFAVGGDDQIAVAVGEGAVELAVDFADGFSLGGWFGREGVLLTHRPRHPLEDLAAVADELVDDRFKHRLARDEREAATFNLEEPGLERAWLR